MNKIQYVKLLNLRGITELKGMTIAEAIKQTGGKPKMKEMVEVNHQCMIHFLDKLTEQEKINTGITEENEKLQKRDDWLTCLENAGVDNWDGYDVAGEMLEEYED